MAVRITITVILGALFNLGLFWLMSHLISQDIDATNVVQATQIQFTRQRQDTQAEAKRQDRVEREAPPAAPTLPQMSFNVGSGVQPNLIQTGPSVEMSKLQLSAGTDTDVVPLVRIPPQYPRRAQAQGIEGWVIVEFSISETGAVIDAKVVDAQPKRVFDEEALKAIARWRYNPKVENGVAVKRVGVQTLLRFSLSEE
jgi:protein TonB